METHDLKGLLTEHPFLAGMRPKQIELIVGCASNRRYGEGEYVAREGSEAGEFYMIREGQLALEVFGPRIGARRILTVHPGEVAGWSWLVEPFTWKFDARAVTPLRVIAVDGRCLRGKCEQDFELGYRLFQRVARLIEDRLMATRLQLLDLYQQEGAGATGANR